jgi:hypothetical protein
MANTFTAPTWIKSRPHASAENQVGDSDPSSRTDVVNRPAKGLFANLQRIVNALWDGISLDFTNLATVTSPGVPTMPAGQKIGGGATILKHLSGTASWNPTLASGDHGVLDITVTGAAVGDTVVLGLPGQLSASVFQVNAWVSATNTVRVHVYQLSGSAWNPGTITVRADVWQH